MSTTTNRPVPESLIMANVQQPEMRRSGQTWLVQHSDRPDAHQSCSPSKEHRSSRTENTCELRRTPLSWGSALAALIAVVIVVVVLRGPPAVLLVAQSWHCSWAITCWATTPADEPSITGPTTGRPERR